MTPRRFLPFPWWLRLWWRLKIACGYLIGRGLWVWDLSTGELWWNRANCKRFGLPGDGLLHDYESFASFLWEEGDRISVRRDVQLAKDFGSIYYSAFCAKDQTTGERILIQAKGWWVFDKAGNPLMMMGWNERIPYTKRQENLIVIRQYVADKLARGESERCAFLLRSCNPANHANG